MTLQPYEPPETTQIVATTDSWTLVVAQVGDLAGKLAGTSFVPNTMRNKAPEVAASILTGREVGLPPMASLREVYVVNGRPRLSAKALRALVLSHGHTLEVTELTDELCTVRGARRERPDSFTEVSFSLRDAQRAGIASKDVWKQYPRQMLAARATSLLCDLLFPDATGGLEAVDDELDRTSREAAHAPQCNAHRARHLSSRPSSRRSSSTPTSSRRSRTNRTRTSLTSSRHRSLSSSRRSATSRQQRSSARWKPWRQTSACPTSHATTSTAR